MNTDSKEKKAFWRRFRGKKQEKIPIQAVGIRSLFRYAGTIELLYLAAAIIASAVYGVAFPISFIILGDSIDSFVNRAADLCSRNLTALSQQHCPPDITLTSINFYTTMPLCNLTGIDYDLSSYLRKPIIMSIILGCAVLLSGYVRVVSANLSAERQIKTIRTILFRSILRKEIAFFDEHSPGELSSYLTTNVNKIHDGIGEKLGSAVEMIATFISGIIIGFSRGWKLSFVILSLSPIIFVAIAVLFKVVMKMATIELQTYGKAGAVAEEVISSIRTVLCYNGQQKGIQRYEDYLDQARKCGIKKGFVTGLTTGVTYFLLFCTYILGFSYGAKLIWEESYSIGKVFIVFVSISYAMFALGQANPYFQAVHEARVAAFVVWQTISTDDLKASLIKDRLFGDIQFSNIHFAYPSRLDVPIFTNLSFHIEPGQTVAFVGSSGSGKSTCVQLLQRFYDPQAGAILIDGKRVSEYNLTWLRQHIGVVSQEPVLFHMTIRENILFGLDSATDQQIQQAAKMANAHDFIMSLPQKYETEVGECGHALSGGQKQRIAIARALLRDPKILLLDEATSALDNESEKIVQDALDRAAQGRTTVIIAHRLSTIRNANKIIVMEKGTVVEEGDHQTLMMTKGTYYRLLQQQNLRQVEEQEEVTKMLRSSNTIDQQDLPIRIDSLAPSIFDELRGKETKVKPNTTLALLRMNKPEWLSIVIGCITCALIGAREPAFCLVQTELAVIFQSCDLDYQKRRLMIYVLIYLGFGLLSLISHTLQGYAFARSGEGVTKRLRSKAFRALLRQEIAYFDQSEHSSGALCTRLATEASAAQGASGVRFGLIIENLFAMSVGILIGLAYSWQLTLLVVAFLPLVLFGGILQIRLTTRFARRNRHIVEDAGKITMEAIQNIRTVMQLTKQNHFEDQYSQKLNTLYQSSRKHIQIISILFAVSSAVFYFAIAAFLPLTIHLMENEALPFKNMFMVLNTVVLAGKTIGRAIASLPDYGKALEAAENIFELLNRKPTIDNQSKDGDEISNFTGQLALEGVYFAYPNRSQSIILKNFTLNIKSGQKIAFVGTSGCGKSTTIQLIERFYDPNIGRLLIDSKDIRSLNLQWYRSQIGVVSQEPVLFDMSIRENIAYGDNNREEIPMDEIIQVAKDANIHEFIQALPQGYETRCGTKGVQLSGGQKQRIAIARALIRNPKILLLDEATSALDSESEQIVQEALDRAQENRTSIIIAHRLSTIQNADLICVVHNGMIVESGHHDELMTSAGRYYRMVQGTLN